MGKWIKLAIASAVVLSLVVGVVGTAMADPIGPNGQQRGAGWGGEGFGFRGIPDSVASLLGLTEEQIAAQRHEGKSLVEIAKNAPKPADENALVNAIVAERQKTVDQRVADGKLTKEQAAQVMERVEDQVRTMVNRTQTGPDRSADKAGLGLRMGRGGSASDGKWGRGSGWGYCPWNGQTESATQ